MENMELYMNKRLGYPLLLRWGAKESKYGLQSTKPNRISR